MDDNVRTYRFGMCSLRRLALSLFVGMLVTITVAWACAIWSPTRSTFDPFPKPGQTPEVTDPDGITGLYYHESGFGWDYLWLRGERYTGSAVPGVNWTGPYGGTYHRLAGWPLRAMWSRVKVLDSQGAGSHFFVAGAPEPVVPPQRRRWELPLSEIVHRGIATQDLPARFKARPDRRLPLVPLALGIAGDTAIYAGLWLLVTAIVRRLRRRFSHPSPVRAFEVLPPRPSC